MNDGKVVEGWLSSSQKEIGPWESVESLEGGDGQSRSDDPAADAAACDPSLWAHAGVDFEPFVDVAMYLLHVFEKRGVYSFEQRELCESVTLLLTHIVDD